MVMDAPAEITAQTVLDILFDMGAKIINTRHEVGQSEILFEYNNKKAQLFCSSKSKTLQLAQDFVTIKYLKKINSVEDLTRALTELLKRVI